MTGKFYRCIDNKYMRDRLTLGFIYTDISNDGPTECYDQKEARLTLHIRVRCDDCVDRWLPLRRFEEVNYED